MPCAKQEIEAMRVDCGLGDKHMRYLCAVGAQRVWSCSQYAVQPSQPVGHGLKNFSTFLTK